MPTLNPLSPLSGESSLINTNSNSSANFKKDFAYLEVDSLKDFSEHPECCFAIRRSNFDCNCQAATYISCFCFQSTQLFCTPISIENETNYTPEKRSDSVDTSNKFAALSSLCCFNDDDDNLESANDLCLTFIYKDIHLIPCQKRCQYYTKSICCECVCKYPYHHNVFAYENQLIFDREEMNQIGEYDHENSSNFNDKNYLKPRSIIPYISEIDPVDKTLKLFPMIAILGSCLQSCYFDIDRIERSLSTYYKSSFCCVDEESVYIMPLCCTDDKNKTNKNSCCLVQKNYCVCSRNSIFSNCSYKNTNQINCIENRIAIPCACNSEYPSLCMCVPFMSWCVNFQCSCNLFETFDKIIGQNYAENFLNKYKTKNGDDIDDSQYVSIELTYQQQKARAYNRIVKHNRF